ncbi:MAG TPA: hypothetical protein DCR93_30625 [Cytophagales bacterium]|nr:hypothetical protein [Cytophagales bacterium]
MSSRKSWEIFIEEAPKRAELFKQEQGRQDQEFARKRSDLNRFLEQRYPNKDRFDKVKEKHYAEQNKQFDEERKQLEQKQEAEKDNILEALGYDLSEFDDTKTRQARIERDNEKDTEKIKEGGPSIDQAQERFNQGYLLGKHSPQFAEAISKINTKDESLKTLQAGIREGQSEFVKNKTLTDKEVTKSPEQPTPEKLAAIRSLQERTHEKAQREIERDFGKYKDDLTKE